MSSFAMETGCGPIGRIGVTGSDRAATLAKHLGDQAVRGAARFTYFLHQFSAEYRGDEWELFELSNGAFYLRPDVPLHKLSLDVPISGFHGEVSVDAAGIVATLHMLSWLASRSPADDGVIDRYFALRKYALSLPEAPKIRAAID